MKKYAIYGNCQTGALNKFLLENSSFKDEYIKVDINLIAPTMTEKEIDIFYKELNKIDLLIIQPIGNLKNDIRYSTKNILKNLKKSCIVIIFPSLFFTGYYPTVVNYKLADININFHDLNLVKNFLKFKTKDNFVSESLKNIHSENYFSESVIQDNINKSLESLKLRENNAIQNYKYNLFINISGYINDNYKKKILFHTINHPTKFLFEYISDKIISFLDFEKTNYSDNLDPLGRFNCIIYNSVKLKINKEFNPETFGQRELPKTNLKKYIEFHYNKYNKIKNKLNILLKEMEEKHNLNKR